MIKLHTRHGMCGFHMTFTNGWTISVQMGPGNYCDNRSRSLNEPKTECANAEVAIWDKDGKFYRLTDGDDVEGYVEPDEIARMISMVSQFTGNAEEMNAFREVHES